MSLTKFAVAATVVATTALTAAGPAGTAYAVGVPPTSVNANKTCQSLRSKPVSSVTVSTDGCPVGVGGY